MRVHILDTPDYYSRGYQFGLPIVWQEIREWEANIIPHLIRVIKKESQDYSSINLIGIGSSGVALMTMLKPCLKCTNVLVRKSFEQTGPGGHPNLEEIYRKGAINIIVDDHIATGRTLSNLATSINLWSIDRGVQRATELIRGIVTVGVNLYEDDDKIEPLKTTNRYIEAHTFQYPNLEFFTQARHMLNKMKV